MSDADTDPFRPPVQNAAFETVYRRTFNVVGRVARRQGVSPNDTEDAIQDTFLVVYRRWGQILHEHDRQAWVHAIATRTCWNYRRARRRRDRHFDEQREVFDVHAETQVPADEDFENREGELWLMQALRRLNSKKRQVVILTQFGQKSAKEVSRLTGVSPNTVASRLRAALAELRRNGRTFRRRESR